MGLSGSQYDRFAGDFTPNKDRRIAEWRKKKDAERKAASEEKAQKQFPPSFIERETPEITKVEHTPLKSDDEVLQKAIDNPIPGGEYKKPRARKKPAILHPTLFGDVE